jgi:hypothetical protein
MAEKTTGVESKRRIYRQENLHVDKVKTAGRPAAEV